MLERADANGVSAMALVSGTVITPAGALQLESLPPPVRRRAPSVHAVTPRPHSRSFPAPIRIATTPPRNACWRYEIRAVYVDAGEKQFTISWKEWIAYVARRIRRPAFTTKCLTPAVVHYRRVRLVPSTECNNALTRHERASQDSPRDNSWPAWWYKPWYDGVPPGVLVKSIRVSRRVNWYRELEEIRRRILRAPFLAEERERDRARSRKYTVGTDELGYLYLMQRREGGPIKLGFALDVGRRRRKLEQQYGTRMVMLATAPGTPNDERTLQRSLSHVRLPYSRESGLEWFRDTAVVRGCLSPRPGARQHVGSNERPPYNVPERRTRSQSTQADPGASGHS